MSCLCLCFSTPSLVVGHFNSPPSNWLLPWVTERRTFSGGTPGWWEMFSVWRLLNKAAWFSTLFRAEGQMDGMMECRLMSNLKKQIKFETDWVWFILISQTDHTITVFFKKAVEGEISQPFFQLFSDPTVIGSSVSHPFKISCFHVFHVSRLLTSPFLFSSPLRSTKSLGGSLQAVACPIPGVVTWAGATIDGFKGAT